MHTDTCLPLLSQTLKQFNIDDKTFAYFSQTWRKTTSSAYKGHITRWYNWALKKEISPIEPTVAQVLRFLREYFETGVGYGALNAARCALSIILPRGDNYTMGEHFLVKWFMKSCYERRPPQPRYAEFWSVDTVLQCIKTWGKNLEMSLKSLSLKLSMLLLLVSSQRGQTILALDVTRLEKRSGAWVFRMAILLKHNSLGQPLDTLTFYPFTEDIDLCVVNTLDDYLKRTLSHRNNEKQLLLSYIAPFKAISRASLARWSITVLNMSGINSEKYKSHSTRGASASHALAGGTNLNAIMRNAGWRNAKTFARFYHKTIETTNMVQASILRPK